AGVQANAPVEPSTAAPAGSPDADQASGPPSRSVAEGVKASVPPTSMVLSEIGAIEGGVLLSGSRVWTVMVTSSESNAPMVSVARDWTVNGPDWLKLGVQSKVLVRPST